MQTGEDSFPVFVLRACLILDVASIKLPSIIRPRACFNHTVKEKNGRAKLQSARTASPDRRQILDRLSYSAAPPDTRSPTLLPAHSVTLPTIPHQPNIPPPQLSPIRKIPKNGFCPEFYRISAPPPPPPLVPHVKKTRNSLHETPHHVKKKPNFLHENLYHVKKMANSLHEKAEKGGWMFNFGCRRYRISCAFGAAAYRSRQRRGELRHSKSKIQDSKSPRRGFVSHSRWEYRRPGGGEGRGKKGVKIYFLLVTHTEIRHLGDT